jgi:O-antigen/teichoic acid export membrane protein
MVNLDMIVVKMTTTSEWAGEYGLYALFAKIVIYAASPLIGVAFTFFSSSEQKKEKKKILWIAGALIGGFSAVMVSAYALIPAWLIVKVGGEQYSGLQEVLYWAGVYGGIYCLVMLLVQYLVAGNRRLMVVGVMAIVVQAVLIYNWHATPLTVMGINIGVGGGLLVILAAGILCLKKSYKNH